jgi:hypothetical protein
MPDTIVDQIVETLRSSSSEFFPEKPAVKTVRVVGHTPKPDHYIYEIVLDYPEGSERVSAKVYRPVKSGAHKPQELARAEAENLRFAYQAFEKQKVNGLPRPVGDFAELGAVVSTKVTGLPMQGIIMKTALLPDSGNDELLKVASRQAGEWLQQFHKSTASTPMPLAAEEMMAELEGLCAKARKDGLPEESTQVILSNARSTLTKARKTVRSSAVLNEFVPLNVIVTESGVGFCEFAGLERSGSSLYDVAVFLAAIEALEKYPFCDRRMTALVQEVFTEAYGITAQEQPLLTLLKVKVLLQMFAQGRAVKESAERKKVMWANVMKRFIQQATERSMAPAA